jgi:hypothetical protein
MTCNTCTEAAKAVALALDDDELRRRLAALVTFEDCDTLIENLHWDEVERYGYYASREDVPGGHH